MSTTHQGSNESGKTSKKEAKPKRAWSLEEEKVLMEGVKELIAQGWKSDNGFRSGYMAHLENRLAKAFPTAGIKGNPHINSKLTGWKRTYSILMGILNRSGVGFNLRGDHKIECDNEAWEEATRTDACAKNWRARSWPLLEDWKEIFGKDRANGVGAADLLNMVNEMIQDDEAPLPSQPPYQPTSQKKRTFLCEP